MKNILKEELKRAFGSKGMWLALAIGIAISVSHVVQYQNEICELNRVTDYEKYRGVHPYTVSDSWIEGNQSTLQSFLYFLVLPILAVLPFGTSYLSDQQNGFLRNIYMRVPRKKYLSAKYIAAFLSGGTSVVIPLILNLLCWMTLVPNGSAQVVMPHNILRASSSFYELYYSYPIVYICLFFVLDFILGGVFACIALSCSYLSDYKMIVAVCPFFFQLLLHIICAMNLKMGWSSVYFAQSGYGIENMLAPAIYIVTGVLVSLGVFLFKGAKEDVF